MRPIVVSLLVGLALCALARPAHAQAVPDQIDFTARLDSNGVAMNGPHSFDFSIWGLPSGGFLFWSETQSGVNVQNGLVDTKLGLFTPLGTGLEHNGTDFYLEMTVDGVTLSPRIKLDSVLFAKRANTAALADNANALGGVDAPGWQRKAASACPAGSAMVSLAQTGTVTCRAMVPAAARTEAPDLFFDLGAFGNVVYSSTFTPTRDGACLVALQGSAIALSPITTGRLFLDAFGEVDGELFAVLTVAGEFPDPNTASRSAASLTTTISVLGGHSYRIACNVGALGDWIGSKGTCQITVFCQ